MRRPSIGKIEEETIKGLGSRRETVTIDVTFKFLIIVVISEAINRKGVSQVGSTRK